MESYFDRMFCRTTCNEYKFTTGQAYTIHRLRNATTDPMVLVMSDNEGAMYQVFYRGDFDYALVKNITGQWLAQFSRYPADDDVELIGAELVAEYKMTEGVTGGIDIERIK